MMKTKFLKILTSAAMMAPFTQTAVLANTPTNEGTALAQTELSSAYSAAETANHAADTLTVPEDAIDSGFDGVRWYMDKSGTVCFEAGYLNRTDSWKKGKHPVTGIKVVSTKTYDKLILPEWCGNLFKSLPVESIETEKMDTSKTADMSDMFACCDKLKSLDLSGFDTSNVRYMDGMFAADSELTSLNVSNFDTSKVTDMNTMFGGCSSLTNLDVSSFDTSNVKHMEYMFSYCENLTSLDLTSFDTSGTEFMQFMFLYCKSLTSLDLSSFDTGNVYDSSAMLGETENLQRMNLSKDFFKGNIFNFTFAYNENQNWMQESNPENQKTWADMVSTWSDEDAGWWIRS
ncbi:MAG: BspA family leucine-rich repeat surface protein [Erysipelotrichaceae bacterium]|nr:BspA family leucine-rich repeat surface protein [Erysipelotrichaceae bacterium]